MCGVACVGVRFSAFRICGGGTVRVYLNVLYIPRQTAFTAAPPGCEARSEDRRRHRAAEERSSARLVASKAGFRGSVMHGCHAPLTAQCAVGAVLHPMSTPCAIRLRRAQLLRFPDKACARRCVRRLFKKRIACVYVSLQSRVARRIHRSWVAIPIGGSL